MQLLFRTVLLAFRFSTSQMDSIPKSVYKVLILLIFKNYLKLSNTRSD